MKGISQQHIIKQVKALSQGTKTQRSIIYRIQIQKQHTFQSSQAEKLAKVKAYSQNQNFRQDIERLPKELRDYNKTFYKMAQIIGLDDFKGYLDYHEQALMPQISNSMLEQLAKLPGTKNLEIFRERTRDLAKWVSQLKKGSLPRRDYVKWPEQPFQDTLRATIIDLEIPRFIRRHPNLMNFFMEYILDYVYEFEKRLEELKDEQKKKQEKRQSQDEQQEQQEQQDQQQLEQQQQSQDAMSQQQQQSQQKQKQQQQDQVQDIETEGGQKGKPKEIKVMKNEEAQEGDQEHLDENQEDTQNRAAKKMEQQMKEELEKETKQLSDELMKDMQEELQPMVDNIKTAEEAVGNIEEYMKEGNEGYDLSNALWKNQGWKVVQQLLDRLENNKQLKELVKQLGRSGGRGPKRRAPVWVFDNKGVEGLIRTPTAPEEVSGLTRSGEIARMLPSEAVLMAAGRAIKDKKQKDELAKLEQQQQEEGKPQRLRQKYPDGWRTAKLLHYARQHERSLLSYELTGWEEEKARQTDRTEYRPASEQGPIIVCLDTSGSMMNAPELIAKTVTLQCMKVAHTQNRMCFVYAFSGYRDVQELEIGKNKDSLIRLMKFLESSFSGGTDVNEPVQRSIDRVQKEEWNQADILMITDGEIPRPNQDLLDQIKRLNQDMKLKVHGFVINNHISPEMQELCTQVQQFDVSQLK